MKIGTIITTAGVIALGFAAGLTPVKAQGPMYDRVNVNLPYTVTIGDKTLAPGDYVIQQLRDNGGDSRVLLIYSDNGMRFETSAITIPTVNFNTPEHTSVVLHHFGPDYYFDKVWIQGKDYGYEFPLPNRIKEREKERMEPVSVAATYATTTTQAAAPPATTQQQTTTMQEQQQTTAPAETAPATTAQTTTEANREAPAPAMPHTSVGWLTMLLGGGSLSGLGLSLRRKR